MNIHTTTERQYSIKELEAIAQYTHEQARSHFWYYRQYITKNMLIGWWQREVATQLQQFYQDWRDGKKPILALQSPPQHGKSKQVVDFISYVAGKHPDAQTIYASYSDRLSTRANLNLQRIIDSPPYKTLFPNTTLADPTQRQGRFLRNLEILEFVHNVGSFRCTTVLGGVTGEGLNLGIIDDPIKGRAEAGSLTIRDKTWAWLTDDFFTRFSEEAALMLIMTRWHTDDPIGRLKELFPQVKLLRYPALAEHDELHRQEGIPLFPELKSKEFLLARKQVMTVSGWESIYQQNPIIVGGGIFPVDQFDYMQTRPKPDKVRRSCRYWDKAGTQDGGAYTAGVLIEELKNGMVVISDVQRGQWGSLEREKRIKQTAIIDNRDRRVEIVVEREPGSGGKESAESTVRNLKGFKVHVDLVTGSKETRAEPYAAQVQNGNVFLVLAEWNRPFLEEHETFPNGKYKDQVDAAAGGFNRVFGRKTGISTGTVRGLY